MCTDPNLDPALTLTLTHTLIPTPNLVEQEIMLDFQKPAFGLFASASLLTVILWVRAAPPPPSPPTSHAHPLTRPRSTLTCAYAAHACTPR